MARQTIGVTAALLLATSAAAQPGPTLLPVRAIAVEGRILLTLPAPDAGDVSGRFLYANSLRTGIGSAELRLDRGMLGPEQIVAFRRVGKKVAVTFENHRFRATGDAGVAAGGPDSFPFSTVAMLDVVSTDAGGGLVVDIAPFLTRDMVGIAEALNEGGKGWKLVDGLSAADPASVKAFPDNIEMEAVQTYQSDTPGKQVEAIAADPRQVSFIVHHSLIRLPAPGFQVRAFDVRSGASGATHFDFGTKLGDDVAQKLATHFRIEKIDPAAARSRVKKPIVFYIDRAAPEPIRTALMDGVNYWKTAFDKAGLIDAFEARVLPDGVDPLDVRYNMVNWSNRLTRGWSYGGGIVDPRTGEIVKGNVVIGALRVRQNVAIFEALAGTAENDTGRPNDPVRVALSRIRQLGGHEVGHALGFAHNFIGSTQDRTLVMEYPGPRIKLTAGRIDLSDAYKESGGAWDDFTVDWLYGQPAPGIDPDAAAASKALAMQRSGLRYVTDGGRGPEGANPFSSMWDDGPDPVAELTRMMAVRRVALDGFGTTVLRAGEPVGNLRRKFVPVWLLHRYNIISAAKAIGGIDYSYTVVGDGQPDARPAPAAMQTAALDALLATLTPTALTVPDRLVMPLSAGTSGQSDAQFELEVFKNAAYSAFDPLVAADAAAQLTLDALLSPPRLIRVVEQHRRDAALMGLDTLLDRLIATAVDARRDAVGRRVAYRTLITLARTAADPESSPDVAAIVADRVGAVATRLAKAGGGDDDAAWSRSLGRLLADDAMLARELAKKLLAPVVPPGMPIGSDDFGIDDDWMPIS